MATRFKILVDGAWRDARTNAEMDALEAQTWQRVVKDMRVLNRQVKMWCVPCKAVYVKASENAPSICPKCNTPW